MIMSSLTKAQNAALEQARQLLAEHFDTAVIAVLANGLHHDGGQSEITSIHHTGGRMAAIGLAVEAQRAIQSIKGYERYDEHDDREREP